MERKVLEELQRRSRSQDVPRSKVLEVIERRRRNNRRHQAAFKRRDAAHTRKLEKDLERYHAALDAEIESGRILASARAPSHPAPQKQRVGKEVPKERRHRERSRLQQQYLRENRCWMEAECDRLRKVLEASGAKAQAELE